MSPSTTFSMQTTHFFGAHTVPHDSRNEETSSSMLMLEPLPFEFDTSMSRFTTSSCNQDLLLEAISSVLMEPPSSVNVQQHQHASVISRRVSDICEDQVSQIVSGDEEDAEEDHDDLFMQGSDHVADETPSASYKPMATPITSCVLDSADAPSSPSCDTTKKEYTKESASARTGPPFSIDMTPVNPSAVGRSWYQRYQELIQFKQEYGRCCVPVYWPQNPPLAQWVKRQRSQFKLRKEGRHSNMSDSRIQALNQVNFIWDSHSLFWEKRLEELKQFREEHGHCRVPTKYPQNQELAVWAKSQRRQFKLFCQGDKKSHITKERIQKLVELGFVFSPRSTKK